MSARHFIALPLPDEARRVLAGLTTDLPGFAWTPPEQLHVTLRFLGELDADRCAALDSALGAIRVAPFLLPLAGVGAFPPRGHPTVLWAGLGRGHPLLFQLRQRLDDSLLALGLNLDLRTFHPHVTLARLRPDAAPVAAEHYVKRHRDFAGPEFRVTRFTHYSSVLQPGGPLYTVEREFPLGVLGS